MIMKHKLNFTFVLHYYDNMWDYINRIIKFIENYWELIMDNCYIVNSKKFDEMGTDVVEFGEIIPTFLKYDEIKTINFSDFELKEDLMKEIENYILQYKEDKDVFWDKTIVIRLTHSL